MASVHMTVEMARAIQKARDEIMAEEDARLFEVLDALAPNCRNPNHPGFNGPICECIDPDCVAQTVHDS